MGCPHGLPGRLAVRAGPVQKVARRPCLRRLRQGQAAHRAAIARPQAARDRGDEIGVVRCLQRRVGGPQLVLPPGEGLPLRRHLGPGPVEVLSEGLCNRRGAGQLGNGPVPDLERLGPRASRQVRLAELLTRTHGGIGLEQGRPGRLQPAGGDARCLGGLARPFDRSGHLRGQRLQLPGRLRRPPGRRGRLFGTSPKLVHRAPRLLPPAQQVQHHPPRMGQRLLPPGRRGCGRGGLAQRLWRRIAELPVEQVGRPPAPFGHLLGEASRSLLHSVEQR